MSRFPRTVLGTVCLPWAEDGSLDDALFRRTITNLVTGGLPDLYVFGTAGEGYAVSGHDVPAGRGRSLARRCARRADRPPMVGLVSLSLATMRERLEFCLGLGITIFQFALPNWAATSGHRNAQRLRRALRQLSGGEISLHYNLMRSGRLVRRRLCGVGRAAPESGGDEIWRRRIRS